MPVRFLAALAAIPIAIALAAVAIRVSYAVTGLAIRWCSDTTVLRTVAALAALVVLTGCARTQPECQESPSFYLLCTAYDCQAGQHS